MLERRPGGAGPPRAAAGSWSSRTSAARPGWPRPCTWRRRPCRSPWSPFRWRPGCRSSGPRSWRRRSRPTSPRRPASARCSYDESGSPAGCRCCAPVTRAGRRRRRCRRPGRRAAGHRRRQGHHRRVRARAGQADRRGGGDPRPIRPGRGRGAGRQPRAGWTAAGVRYRYVRADVTSAAEVQAAVGEVSDGLGAVTAVLHGAGRNEPAALASLDEDAFRRTLAPKIAGLRGDPGRRGPGRAEAAGHVRQHHRPGRAARPGGLRDRQRLADRPDHAVRQGTPALPLRWRWNGRSGPARAWASGSACSSR